MAIIFDAALLERRAQQALTPADCCKIVLCAEMAGALPEATVYSSAQAQGTMAPAVFVRFGKIAAQQTFGDVERMTVAAQCGYLPVKPEDDGENETAMQAMLDALWALDGGAAGFCVCGSTTERTDTGAKATGEIRFDLRREDAAGLAEGIMQTLLLTAQTE